MTDGQLAALLSVLSAIGASIVAILKWSVTRLTAALDTNTQAHLKSVEKMTEVSTKMDFVYEASREVKDFVTEERSGVHEAPTPVEIRPRKHPRAQSPVGLYGPKRPPKEGE